MNDGNGCYSYYYNLLVIVVADDGQQNYRTASEGKIAGAVDMA